MPPILLIHGFPFDNRMWQAQADFLNSPAGGSHRVLAPDLPGFGRSPLPAPDRADASMEAYAGFIHDFIRREARPEGKAIIAGFSMGGYILMALLRAHPEDVAAAMFLDTRAEVDTPEGRAARLKSIEDIQNSGPAGFLENLAGKLLGKKAPPAVRQHVLALMSGQSPQAIIAAQSAMACRRDQSDLLAQLSIPTLILVGADDAITPPSVAVSMQSHMPHAMLVQIVSAGHMAPVEQPDAVNSALKAFLATVRQS